MIVTNVGRDAVDAKVLGARERADERHICVRRSRVVLAPVAGVKLPVADAIQPDRIGHQAGSDGDKTNSSPGRAQHKP